MNAADLIPMPNHNMAIGIQARGGIGLIISTTVLTTLWSLCDHPIITPRGTARRQASPYPTATL